jgi:hypothetical protein
MTTLVEKKEGGKQIESQYRVVTFRWRVTEGSEGALRLTQIFVSAANALEFNKREYWELMRIF